MAFAVPPSPLVNLGNIGELLALKIRHIVMAVLDVEEVARHWPPALCRNKNPETPGGSDKCRRLSRLRQPPFTVLTSPED
jgi:hypothetical protein